MHSLFPCLLSCLFRCVLLSGGLVLSGAPAAWAQGQPVGIPGAIADAAAASADTVQPLPPWVVLVLKPVSDNRVQPVTGVVVSAAGLVLVPFDFAAPGDQLVVLDDGTDFVTNGRAARVERQFPAAGLSVLQVTGLQRPAAVVSSTWPRDGDTVQLAAFPPAELIVQGAAPVHSGARLTVTGRGPDTAPAVAQYAVAPDSRLPNVTGPLLDDCGHLFGFSAAEGIQSVATDRAPRYTFRPGLAAVLDQLNVTLPQAGCRDASAPAAAAGIAAESPAAESPATELPVAGLPAVVPPAMSADERSITGALPLQAAPAGGAAGSQTPLLQRLWWLLVLVVLFLAAGAWLWTRRGRASPPHDAALPAVTMPARSNRAADPTDDGVPAERDNDDALLEIRGRMPDGTSFTRHCRVNEAAIHVVIGRSAGSVRIDSPEVQREHAVLAGSADQLTLSDLGSSRGTWINRVPCLPGEVMYVGPEDVIFLGDVSFQLRIQPARTSSGAADDEPHGHR